MKKLVIILNLILLFGFGIVANEFKFSGGVGIGDSMLAGYTGHAGVMVSQNSYLGIGTDIIYPFIPINIWAIYQQKFSNTFHAYIKAGGQGALFFTINSSEDRGFYSLKPIYPMVLGGVRLGKGPSFFFEFGGLFDPAWGLATPIMNTGIMFK